MKVPKMENQILDKNSCCLHLGRKTFEYTITLNCGFEDFWKKEKPEKAQLAPICMRLLDFIVLN